MRGVWLEAGGNSRAQHSHIIMVITSLTIPGFKLEDSVLRGAQTIEQVKEKLREYRQGLRILGMSRFLVYNKTWHICLWCGLDPEDTRILLRLNELKMIDVEHRETLYF